MVHFKLNCRRLRYLGVIFILVLCVSASFSFYYRLGFSEFNYKALKNVASFGLKFYYQEHISSRHDILAKYYVGNESILFADDSDFQPNFVYQDPEAAYLSRLNSEYEVANIAAKQDSEYEAMLAVGEWLGGLWDHGDNLVSGNKQNWDPSRIIQRGAAGEKFWCEIAAIVAVHTATVMGWPARLVSASRNGYVLEHGVAEIWSNQFNKWFVLDTDFNVVYEVAGIPLSAFELCHNGLDYLREGRLVVRSLGKAKPSLPYRDMIPYYAYVQIDLRNDWLTRRLPKGSPVGGDLSTLWTARDSLGPVFTIGERVDRKDLFDWKINIVEFQHLKKNNLDGTENIIVTLNAYAPYFEYLQVKLGDSDWISLDGYDYSFTAYQHGVNHLAARVVSFNNNIGPVYHYDFN